VAPRSTETELRSLLGCFLFSADDVFKRIGVLSGGERNRYALARMLLQPSNFLLLVEPTNHLDMRAKDVLLESLQEYSGTVIFVSHDRYFLEQLANRVFEVGNGEVRVFPGNYADYIWRKEGGHETTPTLSDVLIGVPPPEPVPVPPPQAASKRVNPMKLKQMQEQARVLEEKISKLEAEIQAAELALSDFSGPEEATRLASLLDAQRMELERTMAEWEQVSEQIEATA
jgi:ATP-binding cassette, subfamily F, member 3